MLFSSVTRSLQVTWHRRCVMSMEHHSRNAHLSYFASWPAQRASTGFFSGREGFDSRCFLGCRVQLHNFAISAFKCRLLV